ncbi:hypothetical protein QU487_10895 [Crenobacter sp. SG2305]|uniref:hypothetical protein n=1 Tax=Crenobacter oryzisoli TaxID=3056844 RepID=UPI0025AB5A47|nr:hypothetical protein [Crenobacter sp. SG2305]MDN0083256.1 hypothetical protein [Crenobacter sp. SG2305]
MEMIAFWFSQPLLDGVSGQTGAALNLADRQSFAEMHPPDLRLHIHGDHFSSPAEKFSRGIERYCHVGNRVAG